MSEFCIVFTWIPGAPQFREIGLCISQGKPSDAVEMLEEMYEGFRVESIFHAEPGTAFIDGTCELEVVH